MDGDHYRISSCDMWVCTVPYCAIGRCKQVDLCFIGSSAAGCHYNAILKICAQYSQLFLTVGVIEIAIEQLKHVFIAIELLKSKWLSKVVIKCPTYGVAFVVQ